MKFPTPRPPKSTAGWVLLLGAMAALPAFATDMYLPTLPQLAIDFSASDAAAQFTLAASLIGMALGTIFIGPLSDVYGRRRPLLIGIAGHVAVSLLSIFSPSIEIFTGLRVIQGVFNAAATVIALAIIRDMFSGAEAARMLSRLMLVIGLSPLLAPSLGSLLARWGGWQMTFALLAVMGVGLIVLVLCQLPETHPRTKRSDSGVKPALRGYRGLLRDRQFVVLALIPGLAFATLMSYVVGSPFVFQEGFGFADYQFALLFAINGLGLVASAQLNASLVRRFAPIRILRVALLIQLFFGVLLFVVARTGFGGVWGVLICLWLVLMMHSLIPPNASALALTRHGERAGTAAAVIGTVQAGVAGVVSPVVGFLGSDAVAMATVMLAAILCATLLLALATPAYRRHVH